MTTPSVAPSRDGSNATSSDLRHLEKVRGIFASLARFVNAQAIYQPNNPHFIRTAQLYEQSFRAYFETEPELVLTVLQYQILWREQVVYDVGCNTESIAFLLYKDGIGELSVQPAVSRAELEQLAGILKGALYNPSAQFDTATALWQAEFANIFYRVLDEQSDGPSSEGDHGGNSSREQPLRAHDHQDIPATTAAGSRQAADAALETLGAYFDSLAHPGADPRSHEQRLRQLHAEHFAIGAGELDAWMHGPRAGNPGDELLVFLRGMLEFTTMRLTPPIIRDVNDTIERLVHFIRDEGNIATLSETLEIVAAVDADALEAGFSALPDRISAELTAGDYLVSLARGLRAGNDPHEVLRYLALAGTAATPALCELLARSTDDAIHEKGCDLLHGCAGDTLHAIVETFNVENAWLAADAVRLLLRAAPGSMPPVIQRILGSPDAEVRRCGVDYVARVATDESAQRLCTLFDDPAPTVRMRAFSSVAPACHPMVRNKLAALCFADDAVHRTPEELEHMFRALGKGGGIDTLPQIRQVVGKKHYLPAGKARSKRDKLLVITSLRHIPGPESRSLLETLAQDSDHLVKTKALHVLKQAGNGSGVDHPATPSRPTGATT